MRTAPYSTGQDMQLAYPGPRSTLTENVSKLSLHRGYAAADKSRRPPNGLPFDNTSPCSCCVAAPSRQSASNRKKRVGTRRSICPPPSYGLEFNGQRAAWRIAEKVFFG